MATEQITKSCGNDQDNRDYHKLEIKDQYERGSGMVTVFCKLCSRSWVIPAKGVVVSDSDSFIHVRAYNALCPDGDIRPAS